MKSRILSFFGLLGLLATTACSGDFDTEPALNRVVPSTLDPLPSQTYVLRNPGNSDPVLFTATWTETLFYLDGSQTPTPVAPVEYTLQVDKAGNGFESAKTVTITSALASNVHLKEFNLLLLDSLGASADEPFDAELRLKVSYGQNTPRTLFSDNTIALSVTPFEDRDPLSPVYITGDLTGWENENTSRMLVMFKDNSDDNTQTYTFTGYFPDNCDFKFVPGESVGGTEAWFDGGGNTLELAESGTPLHVDAGGYKTVTINLRSMAWSIEDYDESGALDWNILGFIGSFCNWENEPLMTQISPENPHIWQLDYTLPELGEGEIHNVKFRGARSWNSRWAAVNPYDVPYGKTVYLTGDEADPNVILEEGGAYRIVFNDLTGHYVILKQ